MGSNIILNIIEILEDGVMICGIFCIPVTKRKSSLILGMLVLLGLCAGGDWNKVDDFFLATIRLFLPLVIWMSWTEGRIIRRLLIYICSMSYLNLPYLCINLVFAGIVGKSVWELEEYNSYQIIRGCITIVIILLLANRLRKIPGYREIVSNLHTKYFLIGNICILAASMVQHAMEDISKTYGDMKISNLLLSSIIVVSVSFYALGVGIVIIDIFRKRYKEESRLKDKYLEIARKYIEVIRENAKETRKMRHDMQAHMNVLKYCMEHEEYQRAKNYLIDIQNHMESIIQNMVSVNHEIVDAVLAEAQSKGEKWGIQWEIEGILPLGLPIEDFDVCTIFSNMLSNSMEACAKVPLEKRCIYLGIRQFKNHLVIEVTNPVNNAVSIEKLGHFTSKQNGKNHGYGIENIRETVKKYEGELIFENEKEKFITRIIFEL